MANVCSVSVTLKARSKEEAKKIYDIIADSTSEEKATEVSMKDTGYGTGWIGNFVVNALKMDYHDIPCRGTIDDYSLDGEDVILWASTAWGPDNILAPLTSFVKRDFPDVEIIYTAEEPGFMLYESNDPMVANTYIVDMFEPIEGIPWVDYKYGWSKKAILELFNEPDLETIEDKYDEVSIHRFEEVDPFSYYQVA